MLFVPFEHIQSKTQHEEQESHYKLAPLHTIGTTKYETRARTFACHRSTTSGDRVKLRDVTRMCGTENERKKLMLVII